MDKPCIITYNAKLILSKEDFGKLHNLLKDSSLAYNECAAFIRDNNIPLVLKNVHDSVYGWMRDKYKGLPAQTVIKIYKDVLAAFRSIRSNKVEYKAKTPKKHNLSIRLDERLYSNLRNGSICLSGFEKNKRKEIPFMCYERLNAMFDHYTFADPLIFIRGDEAFLSIPFTVPTLPVKNGNATGIDLGLKRFMTTSDGVVFDDKEYKARRRRLRHLKKVLKDKGTKSARRKLRKLKRKERRQSKQFIDTMVNNLLSTTDTGYLVIEDWKGIKQNTARFDNGFIRKRHNTMMSQVALAKFRDILTYKAQLNGRRAETVSPTWTSQTDSRTGKRDGERHGCRYVCSDKVVLDADWNAAVNIGTRSKRPLSSKTPIDGGLVFLRGRVFVNAPNACQSPTLWEPCKPRNL